MRKVYDFQQEKSGRKNRKNSTAGKIFNQSNFFKKLTKNCYVNLGKILQKKEISEEKTPTKGVSPRFISSKKYSETQGMSSSKKKIVRVLNLKDMNDKQN